METLKYVKRFPFSKCRKWFLILVWLFPCLGASDKPQYDISTEYEIKAVFVFNFLQFVEWPPNTFPGSGAPFVIGILGDDPFGTYLERIVRGERLHNRAVIVRRYKQASDVGACNILFVNPESPADIEPALTYFGRRHILTVGDSAEFTKKGGMIQLFTRDNKLRMRVNLQAANAAGVQISSKLLRLAIIDK